MKFVYDHDYQMMMMLIITAVDVGFNLFESLSSFSSSKLQIDYYYYGVGQEYKASIGS